MVITEEMKRNFPPITEEELAEIRVPKEELIERALWEFTVECSKMLTEEIYKDFPNLTLDFIEYDTKTGSSHPIRLQFENYHL